MIVQIALALIAAFCVITALTQLSPFTGLKVGDRL